MKKWIIYTISCFLFLALACKKDKDPKIAVPILTTTAISNITANTAMSGGTITSNGGETITASGVCWSTTNQNPTISDDTTKGNTASGSFTSILTNLNSSSKYYVRAYATNRNGTGYGDVVTFNTGNGAPVATGVNIIGTAKGDELLTGNYTYSDPENDAEAGTTFQWYVADDAAGTGETPIEGATEVTFRIGGDQEGKYIRFGVTPRAGAGNQNGVEVKSNFIGAVGDATTVTFMYNGTEVTYGILTSSATGKKWLDRNLGASRVAQAKDDYLAYGHYFQWGRIGDGHQVVTRTGINDADVTAMNGTTSTLSTNTIPSSGEFIINAEFGGTGDWLATQDNNLWQGVNGVNNPCPSGWRLATQDEWAAENISSITDGFEKLKLTYTGSRSAEEGNFYGSTVRGQYWTSTIGSSSGIQLSTNVRLEDAYFTNLSLRANGMACRCIKD